MDRNFITAAMMEMVSEAHVFAEKTGLGSGNLEVLIRENYGELAYTSEQTLLPSPSHPHSLCLCLAFPDCRF